VTRRLIDLDELRPAVVTPDRLHTDLFPCAHPDGRRWPSGIRGWHDSHSDRSNLTELFHARHQIRAWSEAIVPVITKLDRGGVEVHGTLSVSGLCFPGRSALDVLDAVADIGAAHTTLAANVVSDAGAAQVRKHGDSLGVQVAALIGGVPNLDDPHTVSASRDQILSAIATAAAVGARVVYMVTGPRCSAPWAPTRDRFTDFIAPCVEHASSAGVALAVEPANALYADFNFVHTAASAFELVRHVPGLTVCLDIFHTWTEFDLQDAMGASAGAISLVQVSDYVLGDRSLPARAVPGDGAIPIEDIIGWLWDAGYRGIFDLEMNGPRIDTEGHTEAAQRGAAALDGMLSRRIGTT
jgi:sugar phosphate isomerase/epimerase